MVTKEAGTSHIGFQKTYSSWEAGQEMLGCLTANGTEWERHEKNASTENNQRPERKCTEKEESSRSEGYNG